MAQSATGFARKPAAAKAVRAGGPARSAAEAPAVLRAIPLELAPLLSPYRKNRRLSLRIERLHRLARLSTGRNNGDGSWSLASDELDELAYLLPEGIDEPHMLAIRIVGLDGGGGTTLAVLDLPIQPYTDESDKPRGETTKDTRASGTEQRRLAGELAKAKADLAVCETELAEARRRAEEARIEASLQNEAERAVERAAWKRDLDRCLAEVQAEAQAEAAAELERSRAAWQAEQNTQSALSEARGREHLSEAHANWQQQSRDALSQAQEAWKTGEAARLSAAEARWREETARALAEAQVRTQTARDRDKEAELHRLREELAALRETLADRERTLAQNDSAAQQAFKRQDRELQNALSMAEAAWREETALALAEARARETARDQDKEAELHRLREEAAALRKTLSDYESGLAQAEINADQVRAHHVREIQDALSKAENTWKADEAARLAAADTRWREEAARTNEALRQTQSTRDQDKEAELHRLREESAALRKTLADHESGLAQAEINADQARAHHVREIQDALSNAENTWKADEAARLAAAETRWREEAARTNEALRQTQSTRDQDKEAELRRLHTEYAALQASLAEREATLAQTTSAAERAKEGRQQALDAALTKAKAIWKAEEAARFVTAEMQWQEQSAKKLADMTARCKRAEASLAETRAQANTAGPRDRNEAELHRLRGECSALQAALTEREAELLQARSSVRRPDTKIALRTNEHWDDAGTPQQDQRAHIMRHALRNGALAASLAAAAILLISGAVPHVPEAWRTKFTAAATDVRTMLGNPQAQAESSSSTAPDAVRQQRAIVIRNVNLRAGPSTATASISTLQRGVEVATLEKRGNWMLVKINGDGVRTKPRQGWVSSTFLENADGGKQP